MKKKIVNDKDDQQNNCVTKGDIIFALLIIHRRLNVNKNINGFI